MKTHYPHSATGSPWTFGKRCRMLVWEWTWFTLCRWTPKPLNKWRIFWLRLFGATVGKNSFVHQRARIEHPENISIGSHTAIGDRAHLYALDKITIGNHCIIAQEAYLCTGDHKRTNDGYPLCTAPIVIEDFCFIGLRTIVLMDVVIAQKSTLGAGAVVTKNISAQATAGGNPARSLPTTNC